MARVRLVDVAERAGVSMKTVSNVVHDYPHVAPALRTKVQAAIDELGYRPNLTARRLATGRTGMIALAMPEMDHPYFSELSRCIAEEATALGYRVLIEQTLSEPAAERAVLQDREEGLVDGVIFHPVRMEEREIASLRKDVPLVLLGEGTMPAGVDHVMIDNVAAAADGVRMLLDAGRTRIAFLATVRDDITGSTERRLEGYQRELAAAGLPADPELILTSQGFQVDDSQEALARAITAGVEFDAVLCRDDRMAVGAIRALAAAGRRVPEDVAVIGWDDTQMAAYCTPTLTSISPDKREIARTALRLLAERIEGHHGEGRHRIAPHSISERASTPAP